MKTSNIIQPGQTLLDIALQELGDVSRANEIAIMNGISITDDLQPGTSLLLPDPSGVARFIFNLFKDRGNIPASAIIKEEGIEFWAIEKDFVVQ